MVWMQYLRFICYSEINEGILWLQTKCRVQFFGPRNYLQLFLIVKFVITEDGRTGDS